MKLRSKIKGYVVQSLGFLYFWSISAVSFADGIIPISYNDETQSGTDFANTFMKILKYDLMPMLEYGGAIIVIFLALAGVWRGYRESQAHPDSGAFKSACLEAVLLVVIGGALIYVLKLIGDKIPTS